MTLPMIDEPVTDDADTTPYERRGLYAVAVSEVPSADVEGRRAASVWGVIWRILVVVALLCAMSVVQALYYAMVDTRNASPGLLGFAGVTWGTWWGSIILLIVFAVGGLAPAIVAFLTAAARPGRRFAPCMAACVAGMALVWAIIPGNAIGESLWWYECRQSGVCSYFDTGQGILGILPGVAVSVAGVLLTVALWLTVGRATCRESGRETVLGRVLYMLSPAVGSIVLVVNRMVPVGVQTVFAVFLLVLMLGEIVPNELGAVAYVIRKRGSAYWLWPFAIIITWEVLFCTVSSRVGVPSCPAAWASCRGGLRRRGCRPRACRAPRRTGRPPGRPGTRRRAPRAASSPPAARPAPRRTGVGTDPRV